jgi:hypothetical protein
MCISWNSLLLCLCRKIAIGETKNLRQSTSVAVLLSSVCGFAPPAMLRDIWLNFFVIDMTSWNFRRTRGDRRCGPRLPNDQGVRAPMPGPVTSHDLVLPLRRCSLPARPFLSGCEFAEEPKSSGCGKWLECGGSQIT